MQPLQLPSKIEEQPQGKNSSTIIIEPCAPGYGTTVGNALRRVLLSSLPGAAATLIKIKNVSHEFSTLEHVKEDIVEIMLNVKNIRFQLHNVPSSTVTLKIKGEKNVTAKDIHCPSDVEVTSPSAPIATLTDKNAEIEMDIVVEEGRGYVPVEASEKKSHEIGTIALDAIYSPVRNANFSVENVRVGQMTNFDKLTMSVTTDGSISPLEAVQRAAEILVNHFSFIATLEEPAAKSSKKEVETEQKEAQVENSIVEVKPDTPVKEEKEEKKKKKSKST